MATKISHKTMDKYVDGKLVKEGEHEESGDLFTHYWWKEKEDDKML